MNGGPWETHLVSFYKLKNVPRSAARSLLEKMLTAFFCTTHYYVTDNECFKNSFSSSSLVS